MKKINILVVALMSTILFSCMGGSGDDKDFSANYKDQPLQGMIGGKPWTSEMGKVSMSKQDTNETWSFDFTDKRDEEYPCNYPQYEVGKVMFSAKDAELGEKQLKLSFNFSKNRTVTIVYDQDSAKGPMNKIASKGAYEITKVDTENEMVIEGRMDIYVDDANYVNGTFKARYCPN